MAESVVPFGRVDWAGGVGGFAWGGSKPNRRRVGTGGEIVGAAVWLVLSPETIVAPTG